MIGEFSEHVGIGFTAEAHGYHIGRALPVLLPFVDHGSGVVRGYAVGKEKDDGLPVALPVVRGFNDVGTELEHQVPQTFSQRSAAADGKFGRVKTNDLL